VRAFSSLPGERWRNFLYFVIAIAAGLAEVWLIVGWREIDPRNLSWLVGDAAQYQIGWEFMRSDTVLRFPPTWIGRLDYPTGVSASYLDFIPLVGTPLRFVSSLLPLDFQYLGLYAVACFVLQGFFGLKLVSRFSKGDWITTLLGGAFFLFSPILMKELYGHFALLSQWLILACIYFYFQMSAERTPAANLLPFVAISALAGAIQPYFALMTLMVGAAAVAHALLLYRYDAARHPDKRRVLAACLLWGALLVAGTLLSLTVFGFIVLGRPAAFVGGGYTRYAMNLLAPINPQSPWALYLRAFPVVHGWTLVGYNYLGLGVILLLVIVLARRPALISRLWSRPLAPLTAAALIGAMLALSTEVSFADRVLFTVPVPHFIFDVLTWFRGSARLFWPAYYLLMLGAIVGLTETVPSPLIRRGVLAAALAIQFFDVLYVPHGVAGTVRAEHATSLRSPAWAAALPGRRHLVILPAWQCAAATPGGPRLWPALARLAARGGLTLNSVYLGRISNQVIHQDCDLTPAAVLRDGLRADTVYVLNDRLAQTIGSRPQFRHDCRVADGLNLCTHNAGGG